MDPKSFVIFNKDISAPVSTKNVHLASDISNFTLIKLLKLLLAVKKRFIAGCEPGQLLCLVGLVVVFVPQPGCSVGGSDRFPSC